MNDNDAYAKAKASSSAEDDRVEKALEERVGVAVDYRTLNGQT